MTAPHRDLCAPQHWHRSLERSRRRRALAAAGRRISARRKSASLALSAAVAAAPSVPTLAMAQTTGGSTSGAATSQSAVQTDNRVLLERGDTGPLVSEVQREVRAQVDGLYGSETEKAVEDFQRDSDLAITGKVDVRTFMALFPEKAGSTSNAVGGSGGAGVIPAVNYSEGSDGSSGSSSVDGSSSSGDVGETIATALGFGSDESGSGSSDSGSSGSNGSSSSEGSDSSSAGDSGTSEGSGSDEGSGSSSGSSGSSGSDSSSGSSGSGSSSGSDGSSSDGESGSEAPATGARAELIQAMKDKASAIDAKRYSYLWGGGHSRIGKGPYDCSGAVSAVLHAAGLLSAPLTSGGFMSYGRAGKGDVTIYANSGHVLMSIQGRFFGTSRSCPGGGACWLGYRPSSSYLSAFRVRHAILPSASTNGSSSDSEKTAKASASLNGTKRADARTEKPSVGPIVATADSDRQRAGLTEGKVSTTKANGSEDAAREAYAAEASTEAAGSSTGGADTSTGGADTSTEAAGSAEAAETQPTPLGSVPESATPPDGSEDAAATGEAEEGVIEEGPSGGALAIDEESAATSESGSAGAEGEGGEAAGPGTADEGSADASEAGADPSAEEDPAGAPLEEDTQPEPAGSAPAV